MPGQWNCLQGIKNLSLLLAISVQGLAASCSSEWISTQIISFYVRLLILLACFTVEHEGHLLFYLTRDEDGIPLHILIPRVKFQSMPR